MEENNVEQQESTEGIKQWFQDNLRIIVSVVIVVAIAGGIYSYSKRTQTAGENVAVTQEENKEEAQVTVDDQETSTEAEAPKEESKEEATEKAQPQASSKETETAFAETAGKGDGLTILARRSLTNYLEKNPDASLTKEHKIYIEDYLRKKVGFQGRVQVGTSVEFSKDLIQQAIEQSKKLNDKQLENLKQFSKRAVSLS